MSRTAHRLFVLAAIVALVCTGALTLHVFAARQAGQTPAAGAVDPAILNTFKWRSIGPDRGGGSIAISGVKGRANEGYFGATGGVQRGSRAARAGRG